MTNRGQQGQFVKVETGKPVIVIKKEADHYYGAVYPSGITIGATNRQSLARYLRSQGYEVR